MWCELVFEPGYVAGGSSMSLRLCRTICQEAFLWRRRKWRRGEKQGRKRYLQWSVLMVVLV